MPPKAADDSGGIIASILKFFSGITKGKKAEKTPVSGFGQRLSNALKYSWRGVFGFLPVIILVPIFWSKENNARKVELMWYTMFWFILIRPVNVPVSGLVPIFVLPMTGVYPTLKTCLCYMSENITLYLMGSIIILILNISGADRRLALHIIAGGNDVSKFTAKKLVYKCSMAAFLLSFLSNRLIVSSFITEYATNTLMNVESTFGTKKDEPNIREIRYLVNNAIQISASIGSSVMIHSGYGAMAFKSIFCERGISQKETEYPDIFNYLQYSAFALPLAVVTYIVNLIYFYFLASKIGKEMSTACRAQIQKQLKDHQSKLPASWTLHEKLTILFLPITLFCLYYRWSEWIGGWSSFQGHPKLSYKGAPLPYIRDATVAGIFVVILHTLPMSFNFTKYFSAKKRSDLPPLKQESGILWWRYSDKNLNYSYFFLIGAGNALITAVVKTGLSTIICEHSGTFITGQSWNLAMFISLLGCAIACSIMPETAALCVYMPYILALSDGPDPWPKKVYLPCLGLGILSNYGFMYPFKYSPAHSCYYIGKTPVKKMIQHGIISMIICFILCYLAVAFIAPKMWDPDNVGIPPSTAGEAPAPAAPEGG